MFYSIFYCQILKDFNSILIFFKLPINGGVHGGSKPDMTLLHDRDQPEIGIVLAYKPEVLVGFGNSLHLDNSHFALLAKNFGKIGEIFLSGLIFCKYFFSYRPGHAYLGLAHLSHGHAHLSHGHAHLSHGHAHPDHALYRGGFVPSSN